jgi:hypothetical protein
MEGAAEAWKEGEGEGSGSGDGGKRPLDSLQELRGTENRKGQARFME